jgi:pyruvate dehydrogenase (quinone)
MATVGDYLVRRLNEWGINRIYGYPGDGINGIMGALNRASERMKFIQVRHEEMAAFMACAHAKFTGQVGVCLATSGPGAIHLLNGLYDAKMDHQPVVCIIGQQHTSAMGGAYQQEVDLVSLYKDVASEYVVMVTSPLQVRHAIDRAVRIAKDQRTVTCLIFPGDVQGETAEEEIPRKHSTIHSGIGHPSTYSIPSAQDLEKAAEILNSGKKVAILVGAGAIQATEEVMEVAEILGAGVAKALLGKAALPDDLSYVTGSIGLLGTLPSYNMMSGCDTLFMIGSSFPYSEFLPAEGQARGVQIDIDGRMLSLRYPMEINLKGDSVDTLRALIPLLKGKLDRSWREKIQKDVEEWWQVLEARAMNDASPLNPQRVFWELSPLLPDNCIITADSGTTACWYARDLKIREGMMATLSGNLATMGPAIPYAVAAKFAFPERVAIALSGDGAMQMCGNDELITIKKYWKEWSDPRLIILVLNNRDLNMVTWEQRVMEGDPKFNASQEVPDFPYAEYAQSLGLIGIRIDHPDQVAPAWKKALSADRPVLIEAVTDPEVPPLPPHISFEQAINFTKSIIKGDSGTMNMLLQTFKDTLETFIPHKEKR